MKNCTSYRVNLSMRWYDIITARRNQNLSLQHVTYTPHSLSGEAVGRTVGTNNVEHIALFGNMAATECVIKCEAMCEDLCVCTQPNSLLMTYIQGQQETLPTAVPTELDFTSDTYTPAIKIIEASNDVLRNRSNKLEHEEETDTRCLCHEKPMPPDRKARNKLIAACVIVFIFMMGEVLGEIKVFIMLSLALHDELLDRGFVICYFSPSAVSGPSSYSTKAIKIIMYLY